MNGEENNKWNLQEHVSQDMNAIELMVVDSYYPSYLVVLVDEEGNEHVIRKIDDAKLREVLNRAKGKEARHERL
ncbi:MAG: hypothetical protein PUD23_07305 [Prevotella sp.]|nr:hypothetical protein [Prevotella sp.]